MGKDEILVRLKANYPEISRRFGVASLAVFGSTMRGEAKAGSDIDVVVRFHGPATFDSYFDLKFYLERLLGGEVDLATEKMIRPELRPHIEKDLVHVA